MKTDGKPSGNNFRLDLRVKYGVRAWPRGKFPTALNRDCFFVQRN